MKSVGFLLTLLVAVQLLNCVQLFVAPWTAACQASLSFTVSQPLLKLKFIQLMKPPNHIILCHSLPLLPSNFPSMRVFSNDLVLRIMWPKHWSFSISPSSEYSGLISYRIDWFHLLIVQGTLKNLLHQPQFESISSSVLSLTPSLTPPLRGAPSHHLDGI